MLKLIQKIIDFFCSADESVSDEPEFLGEYWVYFGTKGYTTVYAKSSEEAKYVAISTKHCPVPAEKVYAIYKRLSNLRNPAYNG